MRLLHSAYKGFATNKINTIKIYEKNFLKKWNKNYTVPENIMSYIRLLTVVSFPFSSSKVSWQDVNTLLYYFMKNNYVLPITSLTPLEPNLLYILTFTEENLDYVEGDFKKGEKKKITLFWKPDTDASLNKIRTRLNVDPKTISKMRFSKPKELQDDSFICIMPFDLWDEFITLSAELRTPQRKTCARVFVYLYYWVQRMKWRFSHGRNQIVKELKIGNNQLARDLKWLTDKGLIVREDFVWDGKYTFSRGYGIPDKKSSYES